MAQMASKSRMASGEYTLSTSTARQTITHNLGTKKVFVIIQRINEDYSNVDNATRYRCVFFMAGTKEALAIDEVQTYSYNNGNQVHFSYDTTQNSYPIGVYSYFAVADGAFPTSNHMTRANVAPIATNDNEIQIVTPYEMCEGRWVWRIYAFD